jgi:inner membrane protein
MDSMSQMVLGAAIGNEVLGKKLGNKAIWYGAIVGTLPDLDVLYGKFLDPLTATEIHRGFSHSVLFFLFLTPILGWLLTRIEKRNSIHFKEASIFVFLALQTHALLDLFTTWGTQLFWPLETRFSLQSIFVIDPLYTLPFLICLVISMRKSKSSHERFFWNRMGLFLSTFYLFFTLFVQNMVRIKFENQLQFHNISYDEMVVKPSPFNIILWTSHVKVTDGYWVAEYSFFDSKPIYFQFIPKQRSLLNSIENEPVVRQLIRISEGWYCIEEKNERMFFNDLRFGLMDTNPDSLAFSFSYEISRENNNISAKEIPNKNPEQAKKLLSKLWIRIKGN